MKVGEDFKGASSVPFKRFTAIFMWFLRNRATCDVTENHVYIQPEERRYGLEPL